MVSSGQCLLLFGCHHKVAEAFEDPFSVGSGLTKSMDRADPRPVSVVVRDDDRHRGADGAQVHSNRVLPLMASACIDPPDPLVELSGREDGHRAGGQRVRPAMTRAVALNP